MKKILLSAGMIVFMGALMAGATGAFFSDEETSTGNTFTAGAIDLQIDSVGHINGLVCFNNAWHPEALVVWDPGDAMNELAEGVNGEAITAAVDAYNVANPSNVPQAGTACGSTWELTDLGPSNKFFNFSDLKPGDNGENTISIHVDNNDAYMCAIIDNMEDVEVGDCNEPEQGDETPGSCLNGQAGELAEELRFFTWADDGDNIWEENEHVLFSNEEGPASDVIDSVVYPLYHPDLNGGAAIQGDTTGYIGMYWCYGDITVNNLNNTLSCDGATVDNASQTDKLTADITFYVEQSRNNANFECPTINEEAPIVVPPLN